EVIAVEKDDRCVAALGELRQMHEARLRIVAQDALGLDIDSLAPTPRTIVANLPYNIGTELLLGWLDAISCDPGALDVLVLMFQKEVAQRLVAKPRTKAYGRLSVMTQWLCEAEAC